MRGPLGAGFTLLGKKDWLGRSGDCTLAFLGEEASAEAISTAVAAAMISREVSEAWRYGVTTDDAQPNRGGWRLALRIWTIRIRPDLSMRQA